MNADEIIALLDRKTDYQLNLFNREFDAVIRRLSDLVILSAANQIKDPINFDVVFNGLLVESGFYALINDFIDNSYDKTYDEIIELLKLSGIDLTFDSNDLETIRQLKLFDLETFANIGMQAGSQLKKDLFKYSLSNLSNAEIADNIRLALIDTPLAKYAKTYAETSINNFQQQVIDSKVEGIAGLVYIYRGPTPDKKIRDFCKCVINQNKYYDKSDAIKLKNDKRRKWNCRHKVIPITETFAISEGYEKGRFTC